MQPLLEATMGTSIDTESAGRVLKAINLLLVASRQLAEARSYLNSLDKATEESLSTLTQAEQSFLLEIQALYREAQNNPERVQSDLDDKMTHLLERLEDGMRQHSKEGVRKSLSVITNTREQKEGL